MEIEEFISRYPCLYHMAHPESRLGIERHGLSSTSHLLDSHNVPDSEREKIEAQLRSKCVHLYDPKQGHAWIRDNKAIQPKVLNACLSESGMSCREWCLHLNSMVFFWPTEERFENFRKAENYRDGRQLRIAVETDRLVEVLMEDIRLSDINSGFAKYVGGDRNTAKQRGPSTFQTISEFEGEVVEVAVIGGSVDVVTLGANIAELEPAA